jgi:hypothetical protein
VEKALGISALNLGLLSVSTRIDTNEAMYSLKALGDKLQEMYVALRIFDAELTDQRLWRTDEKSKEKLAKVKSLAIDAWDQFLEVNRDSDERDVRMRDRLQGFNRAAMEVEEEVANFMQANFPLNPTEFRAGVTGLTHDIREQLKTEEARMFPLPRFADVCQPEGDGADVDGVPVPAGKRSWYHGGVVVTSQDRAKKLKLQ